jgi:hypothetical protein
MLNRTRGEIFSLALNCAAKYIGFRKVSVRRCIEGGLVSGRKKRRVKRPGAGRRILFRSSRNKCSITRFSYLSSDSPTCEFYSLLRGEGRRVDEWISLDAASLVAAAGAAGHELPANVV